MRRLDQSWIILATGFVVLFFSSGSRFAFGLMLKPMSDDLGWSRSSLSLAVTAFMVVSALVLPVVGRMADRYPLRWTLAGSALLSSVGIGLMGGVNARWQLFALYGVVYALGHAGTSVSPVGVMVSRWFPQRRGIANSAAVSGNAMGQLVIIAALSGSLSTLGWRTSFAALGAASLAIVVPLVLLTAKSRPDPADRPAADETLAPERRRRPTRDESELREVLSSRQLWVLVFVYAICGFQDFLVATHVVAFANDRGLSSVLAGNMLALMGLMGLAGVLASGLLADAFGPARPTALCFLMRIGIFALIVSSQSTAAVLAFALLYGFTFLVTAPLTVVFAGNIFGAHRLGTVSGIISMVHQVAGGLGAFVGAYIFDTTGSYQGAFVLMLALAMAAALATALLREEPSARPAPAESR